MSKCPMQVFLNNCAACHTGGANVVQAEKTLQKDALVQYLDGGFKVESIVTQVWRMRTPASNVFFC